MFDLENAKINVITKKMTYESFSRKYYVSHDFKICLIKNGAGLWQIDNKLYEVKKGDVILLNNKQKRVFKDVSPTDGIELMIIEFEPQFMINAYFSGLLFNSSIALDNKLSNATQIVKLIEGIEKENENNYINNRIIIGAKLVEILSLIGRIHNITIPEILKEDIRQLLEYINQNYTSTVSQKEAAKLLHMSTTSFSKYFSDKMGIGFSQYVMRKRIYNAIHLLETEHKTVLDISLECGFNNLANFYKAFKKITGKNPGCYRNANENNYI